MWIISGNVANKQEVEFDVFEEMNTKKNVVQLVARNIVPIKVNSFFLSFFFLKNFFFLKALGIDVSKFVMSCKQLKEGEKYEELINLLIINLQQLSIIFSDSKYNEYQIKILKILSHQIFREYQENEDIGEIFIAIPFESCASELLELEVLKILIFFFLNIVKYL